MTKHYLPVFNHDQNDDLEYHPICKVIADGGKIGEVSIDDTFIDDRETCYDVTIEVDGVDFQVSLWWVDPSIIKHLSRAKYDEKSQQECREYFMSYYN